MEQSQLVRVLGGHDLTRSGVTQSNDRVRHDLPRRVERGSLNRCLGALAGERE